MNFYIIYAICSKIEVDMFLPVSIEEVKKLVSVTTTRIGSKPITFQLNIAKDIPYELIGDKIHVKEIIREKEFI